MGVYFAVNAERGYKVANICASAAEPLPDGSDGRMRRRLLAMIRELLPEPDIGQLQFVAAGSAAALVQSGLSQDAGGVWHWTGEADFDGWVVPDGSKFSKSDFPAAYTVYGGASAEWFAVPDLKKFFKLNPGTNRERPTEAVARRHVVARHSHSLGAAGHLANDIVIKNAISAYESTAHGNVDAVADVGGVPVPYLCPGYNPTESTFYDFSSDPVQRHISPFAVDARFTSTALLPEQTDDAGEASEAYPTHVALPVLLYIGRKSAGQLP